MSQIPFPVSANKANNYKGRLCYPTKHLIITTYILSARYSAGGYQPVQSGLFLASFLTLPCRTLTHVIYRTIFIYLYTKSKQISLDNVDLSPLMCELIRRIAILSGVSCFARVMFLWDDALLSNAVFIFIVAIVESSSSQCAR